MTIKRDRIPSQELCESLAKFEERPWLEYGKRGKPINQHQLATLLSMFRTASGAKIKPQTIRVLIAGKNTTAKGYKLEDFEAAFDRYLAPLKPPSSSRHTVTPTGGVGENGDFASVTEDSCDASKGDSSRYCENECDSVTAPQGGSIGEGVTVRPDQPKTADQTKVVSPSIPRILGADWETAYRIGGADGPTWAEVQQQIAESNAAYVPPKVHSMFEEKTLEAIRKRRVEKHVKQNGGRP
jgi:hypothetical protein